MQILLFIQRAKVRRWTPVFEGLDLRRPCFWKCLSQFQDMVLNSTEKKGRMQMWKKTKNTMREYSALFHLYKKRWENVEGWRTLTTNSSQQEHRVISCEGNYLSSKNSIRMHINAEVMSCSRAEEADIEQAWWHLNHRHLLVKVCRHGLFAKDHNRAGCVNSQQILLGTPLEAVWIEEVLIIIIYSQRKWDIFTACFPYRKSLCYMHSFNIWSHGNSWIFLPTATLAAIPQSIYAEAVPMRLAGLLWRNRVPFWNPNAFPR